MVMRCTECGQGNHLPAQVVIANKVVACGRCKWSLFDEPDSTSVECEDWDTEDTDGHDDISGNGGDYGHAGDDISVELVGDRERFIAKIRDYQHEPEMFIDIETADWWTPTPRVALLQVLAGREVAVFDVLAPGMEQVLSEYFIPHVMANERIRKWAHNASYERRFLGDACVQNLECTLRMARGIAFHRLPIETLSLGALSEALFGVTLDKTFQKADWAVRPLSPQQVRYAAADTIWCARLRRALEAIERPPRPEEDDMETIDSAFPDAKLRELSANGELKVLRESVRSLMRQDGLRRFSRFTTWAAERLEVPLRPFVVEVGRVDPARMLDLEIRVTDQKLALLAGTHERVVVRTCRAVQSLQLRAPRLRLPRGGTLPYRAGRDDAERVTRDYEERRRNQRMASSLVAELKQRMRGVFELRGATEFRAWRLGPGPVSLFIDVRDALMLVPQWADTMVPLTKNFRLAIGEDAVASLAPATNTKASSVIRWCSKSDMVGVAAQEWRWWTDSTDEDE